MDTVHLCRRNMDLFHLTPGKMEYFHINRRRLEELVEIMAVTRFPVTFNVPKFSSADAV